MRMVALLVVVGCNGSKSTGVTGDTGGGGAATFSQVRDQVLVTNCALSGCHSAGDAGNGMTLPAGGEYDAIVNVESTFSPSNTLVLPGDADHSYLVMKLQGSPGITGGPMPPPFGNLDPALIEMVRSWIDDGAPNN
jgi:hypothetical protein